MIDELVAALSCLKYLRAEFFIQENTKMQTYLLKKNIWMLVIYTFNVLKEKYIILEKQISKDQNVGQQTYQCTF